MFLGDARGKMRVAQIPAAEQLAARPSAAFAALCHGFGSS